MCIFELINEKKNIFLFPILLAIPSPRTKDMTNDSPAPFFTGTPDIWVPIPNTLQGLPLMWEHTTAIRRLARFFADRYTYIQQSQEQGGLEKSRCWMVMLCQMTASIYEGIAHEGIPVDMEYRACAAGLSG